MGNFGDFKEEQIQENKQTEEAEFSGRVKMPRGKELVGIVIKRLGANRMDVKATDNKSRNCRVPGRFKRTMWLRPNDVVLIAPWPDDNDKADIIFKYNSSSINQLKKRGILSSIKIEF